MAVANSLAGIQGGARQVECAINGIGERAGNAALEEIAAALMVRRDQFPYTNNIKMDQLYPTSQMLAEFISFGCCAQQSRRRSQRLRARVRHPPARRDGQPAHLRDHDARLRRRHRNTNLVLGKHSGRRALADRLEELGHPLTREQLDEVYHRFTELADRKKYIYDQDLLGLSAAGQSHRTLTH